MSAPTASDLLERANACGDQVFISKFVLLPGYIQQWTQTIGGLHGKTVLDFGCGNGTTACAVAATKEAAFVDGVDINAEHRTCAQVMEKHLQMKALPENLSFRTLQPGGSLTRARYDVVYSWSVFEHIDRSIFDTVVRSVYDGLTDDGLFFLQVAPLFYSAEGSHLAKYGTQSWEHLSLQLNRLRALVFDHPDFSREEKAADWGCFETLNKITAAEVIEFVCNQGFEIVRKHQTQNSHEPPASLRAVFDGEILKTEQIVALFRKTG